MGVSYGNDRGSMGYAVKTRQLRRCNNCGHTAKVLYTNHKVWANGKSTYCGYMRVVRDE